MTHWNYFDSDHHYVDVLHNRLKQGVFMDSCSTLAGLLINQPFLPSKINILDIGSGPGHYYPHFRRIFGSRLNSYSGLDIVEANIVNGNEFFSGDPAITFIHGNILEPFAISPSINLALSANTLPHLPCIKPVVSNILRSNISLCAFRMLIGSEIVISKKLVDPILGFENLSSAIYQHNNIYNVDYIQYLFGPSWRISIHEDFQDLERLERHQGDVAYANASDSYSRVSRAVGNLVFKGDIYMPWKILIAVKDND